PATTRHLLSFPTRRSSDLACEVAQEILDDAFGSSVDVLRRWRCLFGNRERGGLSVDRRRRRKHERRDARLAHDLDQRQCTADVEDRKSTRLNSSHVKISYA